MAMARWAEWLEEKAIDWPTLLELLRDMVADDLPVVVTAGAEDRTSMETEGCLVAHQHHEPFGDYLERETFGLSSNGVYAGGFSIAPSGFQEATFWSADRMCYFALTVRFNDLVLQIRDQDTNGTESGRNSVP